MKFLRNILDNLEPQFTRNGKFKKLYPIYEMIDTFLFTPSVQTKTAPYVRDNIDLKRSMVSVRAGCDISPWRVAELKPCFWKDLWTISTSLFLLQNIKALETSSCLINCRSISRFFACSMFTSPFMGKGMITRC